MGDHCLSLWKLLIFPPFHSNLISGTLIKAYMMRLILYARLWEEGESGSGTRTDGPSINPPGRAGQGFLCADMA